jgi:hypothetical protein
VVERGRQTSAANLPETILGESISETRTGLQRAWRYTRMFPDDRDHDAAEVDADADGQNRLSGTP